MRARDFLNEQEITDRDAQVFLLGLITNAYSLGIKSLPMKGLLKSMLDQGYLRDAKWVLHTINGLPDDENLVVDKTASDKTQLVLASDEEEDLEGEEAPAAPDEEDAEQVVDKMAKDALEKRTP